MTFHFDNIVLPIHLAKRFVENHGGVATELRGRLEIRRNGELMALAVIHDDCVRYQTLCSAFIVPMHSTTRVAPIKINLIAPIRTAAASYSHWGLFE